ncbi:MAG TPA: peptide-methionine (S)-S-oxide reductase MsrA [Bacteroidales bacterium]|nr:peptide-methionine (S)-S-oxide reductase MsrA [Bacteroidales bacterium]
MKALGVGIIITVMIITIQNQQSSALDREENFGGADTATFASGCFWCTEAIFQQLEGVQTVLSGYTGGNVKNPAYREVCNGTTGHAEAVRITYDPQKISYIQLLEVFFKTHDPTTLNRQGADVGTQYRSAIFYHNVQQLEEAEKTLRALDASGAWDDPIVTEISKAGPFYPAENYHQDYFNNNRTAPYCSFVIVPKIEKFQKTFGELLKK